jgi:penicillin-binding protein activator
MNSIGEFHMILNRTKTTFVAALAFVAASSCSPKFQGEYSDPDKAEIVDDKWNETDAKKTAEVMITSVLGRPWYDQYKKTHGGKQPIVIVQDIENRSDEHIDTKALTEFMESELVNSGKVRFVEKGRRQQILDELAFHNSGAVAQDTKKKTGNMTGADFMLAGAISSQVHTQEGVKTVSYQTQMKLINIETTELNWTDKHEIKKKFKRSGSSW